MYPVPRFIHRVEQHMNLIPFKILPYGCQRDILLELIGTRAYQAASLYVKYE
jgi:hypothetical protein